MFIQEIIMTSPFNLSLLRGGHSTPMPPTPAAETTLQSTAAAVVQAPVPSSWKKTALIAAAAGLGIAAVAFAWRHYTTPSAKTTGATLEGKVGAPDASAGQNPQAALPAPTVTPPVPILATTLAAESAVQEERFKAAVDKYLVPNFRSENYTPRAYKDFIRAQRTQNPHVSETRMHKIVAERFVALHSAAVPGFIALLRDADSVEIEIAEVLDAAHKRETKLKTRDKTLAGESRFDGKIDEAWTAYFNAHKDLLRALAPLCRFIKGEKAELSDHEAYMLDAVITDSKSADGARELRAMEEGLKSFAAGNASISPQDLLTTALSLTGSEGVVSALQRAVQASDTAFATYRALDDERTRITGKDINPEETAAARDSELAHVYDPVEEARQAILRERAAKIAFIGGMSSSEALKAAHDAVEADPRRIGSTGAPS